MVYIGDILVAVGGLYTKGDTSCSVEVLRPNSTRWEYIAPLPEHVQKPQLVPLRDRLVVVTLTESLCAHTYDFKTNTWSTASL
jgi:hypothetical protein